MGLILKRFNHHLVTNGLFFFCLCLCLSSSPYVLHCVWYWRRHWGNGLIVHGFEVYFGTYYLPCGTNTKITCNESNIYGSNTNSYWVGVIDQNETNQESCWKIYNKFKWRLRSAFQIVGIRQGLFLVIHILAHHPWIQSQLVQLLYTCFLFFFK